MLPGKLAWHQISAGGMSRAPLSVPLSLHKKPHILSMLFNTPCSSVITCFSCLLLPTGHSAGPQSLEAGLPFPGLQAFLPSFCSSKPPYPSRRFTCCLLEEASSESCTWNSSGYLSDLSSNCLYLCSVLYLLWSCFIRGGSWRAMFLLFSLLPWCAKQC